MQRTAFVMATALATATPAALAGGGGFQDYARVTGIEPQYEQLNVPATECYSEYVPQAAYGSPAGRLDRWETRVVAYRVSYEYRGYGYTTVLPYDPGPTLPVTVTVTPVPDRLAHYSGQRGDYRRE